MTSEIRQIPGEEGYFCNREGECFSTRPINGKGPLLSIPRLLRPQPCSSGHYLQISCGRRKVLVHRAVAATWIGPAPTGADVCHLDGNSHNNAADNLTYGTRRENVAMQRDHGTAPIGSAHGGAILTEADIPTIRARLAKGERARTIAAEYGLSPSAVTRIGRGETWQHVPRLELTAVEL